MKRYIWILGADLVPYLKGAGGVSATYILPKSHAPEDSTQLAGGFVWIVLRGPQGDVLFAQVCVEMVEQFEDGNNADDFLLTTNFVKSYRCSITYDSGIASFLVRETTSFPLGMSEVKEGLFEKLSIHARNAIVIKLQAPTPRTLNRIDLPFSQKVLPAKSETVMAAVTGQFSLEEVWAGNSPKLPPFANFSYHAILSIYGKTLAENLIESLCLFDPITHQSNNQEDMDRICTQVRKPVVDVNLLPIDPNQIYARKFIARCQNLNNLADILEKTEHAEKRHQDMLRDIATKLKSMGFSPLQSSSIDLFVMAKNTFIIFELKTATPQNIMSQAAKGTFQLGCYNNAITDEMYSNGKMVLVVETTGVHELNSYVFDVLSVFGLSVLFYDVNKQWPDRLKGMKEIIDDL